MLGRYEEETKLRGGAYNPPCGTDDSAPVPLDGEF